MSIMYLTPVPLTSWPTNTATANATMSFPHPTPQIPTSTMPAPELQVSSADASRGFRPKDDWMFVAACVLLVYCAVSTLLLYCLCGAGFLDGRLNVRLGYTIIRAKIMETDRSISSTLLLISVEIDFAGAWLRDLRNLSPEKRCGTGRTMWNAPEIHKTGAILVRVRQCLRHSTMSRRPLWSPCSDMETSQMSRSCNARWLRMASILLSDKCVVSAEHSSVSSEIILCQHRMLIPTRWTAVEHSAL